jgi:hypothetical protein
MSMTSNDIVSSIEEIDITILSNNQQHMNDIFDALQAKNATLWDTEYVKNMFSNSNEIESAIEQIDKKFPNIVSQLDAMDPYDVNLMGICNHMTSIIKEKLRELMKKRLDMLKETNQKLTKADLRNIIVMKHYTEKKYNCIVYYSCGMPKSLCEIITSFVGNDVNFKEYPKTLAQHNTFHYGYSFHSIETVNLDNMVDELYLKLCDRYDFFG